MDLHYYRPLIACKVTMFIKFEYTIVAMVTMWHALHDYISVGLDMKGFHFYQWHVKNASKFAKYEGLIQLQ